jgi:hypothetical protein
MPRINFPQKFTLRTAALGFVLAAAATTATATPRPDDKPAADGWVQLFNGKDLTGWKIHPKTNPGAFTEVIEVKSDDGRLIAYDGKQKDGKMIRLWRVEDGMLIGAGPASHLFSEQEYDDFHFRVEAKINDGGNSGQYFRTRFGPGFPQGYEAQINATHRDPIRTGSIYPAGPLARFRKDITVMNTAPHEADEFFTQEVIADGAKITILVNDKKTIEWTDPNRTYIKGHFALQGHDPGTIVTFKKIEYKPLKK